MVTAAESACESIPKPEGRFNRWGERKALEAHEERLQRVLRDLTQFHASARARSLFWAARLTDSTGVEFVFVSNVQFSPVILGNARIHLMPCFTPLNPLAPVSEKRQAAMMKWGQFIYDGWVPGVEMSPAGLEHVISQLDGLVSLFSVVGRFFAYWEPKYWLTTQPVPSHVALRDDFEALMRSAATLAQLPEIDRLALDRSVAWMSNALRSATVQRFLMLFLSIESLATYIESSTFLEQSVLRTKFAKGRVAGSERNRQRDECIQKVLACGITADSIQKAYWSCINESVRDRLEDHLDRVLDDGGMASRRVFHEEVGGKTLWRLRNEIAHGSLSLLGETDVMFIASRLEALETIARDYLRKILSELTQEDYFPKPQMPIHTISFGHATVSAGVDFTPSDMAEYYANVEALSHSFLRIRFG